MVQPSNRRLATEQYVTDHAGTGGGGAVSSVNAKTGAVVLSASDVGAQPAGSYAATQRIAATVTTAGALVIAKHNPVDATAGPLTMTLPTGQPEGTQISVEKVDATANVVSVTGSVRGVGSSTLTVPWAHEALLLRADSTGSWWPISGHKTKASLDAAYEAKVSRAGATTGQVPVLQGDGTLAFGSVTAVTLTSPNGTHYAVTVGNDGALTTTAI